jgi:hypothetical protein
MRSKISDIIRHGYVAATTRPRDDAGVADDALITAGKVIAGGVLVAAIAAYVNSQIGILGG